MELTDQQKTTVAAWVREKCGLSEIQRRLTSEFGLRPTFMDVRFLILDLGLELYDESAARKVEEKKAEEKLTPDDEEIPADDSEDPMPDGVGGVSVEVDRLIKPGSLVSGSVCFSDGVKAAWMLDQMGRLSLEAQQPGYRPSPEDIEGFQRALQHEIAKKGY